MPQGTPKKVYVIAGEASGDLHGANLIENLHNESASPIEIHGVGGDRIKAAGAKDFVDLAHFHVTGFSEAIRRYPDYKRAEKTILADVARAKPDVAVLIDNPGFNLHLAAKFHAMGIPVAYYISPQLWAWGRGRIEKIRRYVRKMLVVFDFEKTLYEEEKIPVSFVGHPLKDMITEMGAFAERPPGLRVCLLPGSRKGELKLLLEIFLKAAAELKKKLPGVTFQMVKSPSLPRDVYDRMLATAPVYVELIENDGYAAIRSSDVAIACSGTVTLECALLGVPVIICNRGTLFTYAVMKAVVRVPYLGLPNLILGEKRFPEQLQFDCTPPKIAAQAAEILTNLHVRAQMKSDLAEVSRRLGPPGASRRAAIEVLNLIK